MGAGFKRQCFAPEQEMRLLLLNEAKILGPLSSVDEKGRRFVRYDFVPPLRSAGVLQEITIGPRAPAEAEEWVVRLLRDNGYPIGSDGKPLTVIRRSG